MKQISQTKEGSPIENITSTHQLINKSNSNQIKKGGSFKLTLNNSPTLRLQDTIIEKIDEEEEKKENNYTSRLEKNNESVSSDSLEGSEN